MCGEKLKFERHINTHPHFKTQWKSSNIALHQLQSKVIVTIYGAKRERERERGFDISLIQGLQRDMKCEGAKLRCKEITTTQHDVLPLTNYAKISIS